MYALGLGLPFLLAGLFVGNGIRAASWLQRHMTILNAAGGSILCFMGILLITNQWLYFLSPLLRLYSNLNWPPV